MTLNKFVFKSHKWLALAAAVASMVWFVSGVAIVLPEPRASMAVPASELDVTDVRVAVPEAVQAAESAAGRRLKVRGVVLKLLGNRGVYEISSDAGTCLVDAASGQVVTLDESAARSIAESLLAGRAQIASMELHRRHVLGYGYGPLPVFQIQTNAADGTRIFLAQNTGELRIYSSAQMQRIAWHDAHNFTLLRGLLPNRAIRGLLLLAGVVASVMGVFGVWILWIQLRNWMTARRARLAA